MPLIVLCKSCGDPIPNPRVTSATCGKPECKKIRREQIYAQANARKPQRGELRCRICGEIIPIGSGKHVYCPLTKNCTKIGKSQNHKRWKRKKMEKIKQERMNGA